MKRLDLGAANKTACQPAICRYIPLMPIEIPVRERCAFCNVDGRSTWATMVEELDDTCAFLSPRQYRIGALLVIPRRHAPTVLELETTELEAVYRHVRRLSQALMSAFDPA